MKNSKLLLVSALAAALAAPAWAGNHEDGEHGAKHDKEHMDHRSDMAADNEFQPGLHGRVKAALIGNNTLKARDINIEVEDGIVQISGFVATEDEVALADELLEGTEGMVELRNHLHAMAESSEPTARAKNVELASKVKAQLVDNEVADADEVLVEVRDGVVLLAGFVDSADEAAAAEAAAANVEGVVQVINSIDIATQSE